MWSIEAFEDFSLNSKTFTNEELALLNGLLSMLIEQAPALRADSKVKAILDKVGIKE